MKLKLFLLWSILQRCSYIIYILIIYVLVEFISFLCYKFAFILLKTFHSFNLFMSLNICVKFRAQLSKHMLEIIDCFQILNTVYNEEYVCSLQQQCLILRNLNSIKPCRNIFNNFNTIFHTVLIYLGWNTSFIIIIGLTWALQICSLAI